MLEGASLPSGIPYYSMPVHVLTLCNVVLGFVSSKHGVFLLAVALF